MSDHFMPEPFFALETCYETQSAYSPICEHTDPHRHWTESQNPDQENAEADPKSPHGNNGNDHGKFHIAGCP